MKVSKKFNKWIDVLKALRGLKLWILSVTLATSGCCNVLFHCEEFGDEPVTPRCNLDAGLCVESVVKSGRCDLLDRAAAADPEGFSGVYTVVACLGTKYDFEFLKQAVASGKYGDSDDWIQPALYLDDVQVLSALEKLGAHLDAWRESGANLLANAIRMRKPKIVAYLESRGMTPVIAPVTKHAIVPVDTIGLGVSSSSGSFATVGLGIGLIRRRYVLSGLDGYDDRWTQLDLSAVLEAHASGRSRRAAVLRFATGEWRLGLARLVANVDHDPSAWRLSLGPSREGFMGFQIGPEIEDGTRRVMWLASFDVSLLFPFTRYANPRLDIHDE